MAGRVSGLNEATSASSERAPQYSATNLTLPSCCHHCLSLPHFPSAPKALSPSHDWSSDLCHLAPSGCNAAGQLTHLVLPGLGLSCPDVPPQLAALPALHKLDLTGNDLGAATVAGVAAALSNAKQLEEIALGSTGLSGPLDCSLAAFPHIRVRDVYAAHRRGAATASAVTSADGFMLLCKLSFSAHSTHVRCCIVVRRRPKWCLHGPLPLHLSPQYNIFQMFRFWILPIINWLASCRPAC